VAKRRSGYGDFVLIATWNVNSLNARMPRVTEWLATVQPDVLLMQETKMADAAFPHLEFAAMGYESVHFGEGRWNGVAVLSKFPLDRVHRGFRDSLEPDPDARIIWVRTNGVEIASVYVPNGREVGADHYVYKLAWLARLRDDLDANSDPAGNTVIGGDWNIIPADIDVWDPAQFEGSTHVTPAERDALDKVKAWGLVDTFRDRYPEGGLYSYWDYRNGDFHKKHGLRIDYLLSSEAMAARCSSDLIDRNARKGQKPSDHAPVLAQYDLAPDDLAPDDRVPDDLVPADPALAPEETDER
jgi:exodeoxyribonuclease-3